MCATFLGTRLCLVDSYMKHENDTDYENQLNLQCHEIFSLKLTHRKRNGTYLKIDFRISRFSFFSTWKFTKRYITVKFLTLNWFIPNRPLTHSYKTIIFLIQLIFEYLVDRFERRVSSRVAKHRYEKIREEKQATCFSEGT